MGTFDALTSDGTLTLKVSDLKTIFKNEAWAMAENKCLINGLKAGLPAEHILTMIGEKKEEEK